MQGFDYRTQTAAEKNLAAWRDELSKVVAAGGYRRVEDGETFAHDRRGKMLFEVYGNVRLPVESHATV